MTNANTTSMQNATQRSIRAQRQSSDAAPMVITRLSGWIDTGEVKTELRGWIVPTRVNVSGR